MLLPTLLLSALLHTCTASSDLSPCFFANQTWLSDDITDILPHVVDHTHCQETCLHSTSCSSFTWFSSEDRFSPLACVHFQTIENQTSCSSCISGPFTCMCSTQGSCIMEEDNLIDYIPGVQQELDCKDLCLQEEACSMYTWHDHTMAPTHTCLLFSSCDSMDNTCSGCFSGPPDCSDVPKKDVLLFSPSLILDMPSFSDSSCTVSPHPIPSLSSAVSMLLEPDHILVCGGHINENHTSSCYSSSFGSKWISQPGLGEERAMAAASRDPRGWMVTGGMTSRGKLASTEVLQSDGSWLAGPPLPEPTYGHCQVSTETHTFVIGGLGTDHVWSLNISSTDASYLAWSPVARLPTLREYPTCVLHNNEIWVMGKQMLEPAVGTDILSLEDYGWRKGPELPVFMPQGLEYQGDLYVFGAKSGDPILKLAPQAEAWVEIGKITSSSFPPFMTPIQVFKTYCK